MKKLLFLFTFCLFSTFLQSAHAGGVSNLGIDKPVVAPSSGSNISIQLAKIKGRLAFFNTGSCNSTNYTDSMNTSQLQCNLFRRIFDPQTGTAYPDNNQIYPESLRPLTASVEVAYGYNKCIQATTGVFSCTCPNPSTSQSDLGGYFEVKTPTQCRKEDPDFISVRAILHYEAKGQESPNSLNILHFGQIRALWDRADISSLYPIDFGSPVYSLLQQFDNQMHHYVYPVFHRKIPFSKAAQKSSLLDLGNVILPSRVSESVSSIPPLTFEGTPSNLLGIFSLELQQWQDLIELHDRLKKIFLNANQASEYREIFVKNVSENCMNCFTLGFLGENASAAYPGHVGMVRPKKNVTLWGTSINPLAHEFGHTIHFAYAPSSSSMFHPISDNLFASASIDANNILHNTIHTSDQLQEMGEAFVEGIPSTLSQYLVNGCNEGWISSLENTPGGNPLQTSTPWDLDPACDPIPVPANSADHCAYHHFRYHMNERKITEGSTEWNKRYNALYRLKEKFPPVGTWDTSNNESRYTTFTCDLLATNPDITHGTYGATRAGIWYYPNYLATVGRILDGTVFIQGSGADEKLVDANGNLFEIKLQYSADVSPKTESISYLQFLNALNSFCPECETTEFPEIGYPVDVSYPDWRLSTDAKLAPQTLGRYLIQQGWMSKAQIENILRANFMEELDASLLTP